MFELNKNLNVQIQKVYDSNFQRLNDVYVVDNFYKDPDRIRDYFLNSNPIIHKDHENGLNGVAFEDRRWAERTSQIEMAYEFMSDLCKQPAIDNQSVLTNQTKFRKQDFNDYKNNYWWPHTDEGYTAILYLNDDRIGSGTNLYELLFDDTKGITEHQEPWQPKQNYNCIKHLVPAYNRLVLFDGLCYHGMNICTDRYFDEYRLNQVFFFKHGTI